MRYSIGLMLLAAAPVFAQQRQERSCPVFFIPNLGQVDGAVRFMVDTPELRAGFTSDSAILQLGHSTLRVRFAGANPAAAIEGGELRSERYDLWWIRPNCAPDSLPIRQFYNLAIQRYVSGLRAQIRLPR